jgi:perosamine synthetase
MASESRLHPIPYSRQFIDQDDIDAVCAVLRSDYLTQGPAVERFEHDLCVATGARHAVAFSSGTAALHVAVASLRIPPGTAGVTSALTFAASANCMVYNDIRPLFCDIDRRTYTMDPDALDRKLKAGAKVVIPVHFAGQACDMEAIAELARARRAVVIEDAAHALGSRYADGSPVGNCRYSAMTVFSFHPVKTITTGEGGAVTTNDDDLAARLRMLRSHGITRDPALLGEHPGPWYYEMQELGFNYRLTDLQAALGSSQLAKLGMFIARRRAIVARYNKSFSDLETVTTPHEKPGLKSAFHLYVLLVDFDRLDASRAQVMDALRREGVCTQVHYLPVYLHPFYRKRFGYKPGECPVSEEYYRLALSLPLFPGMNEDDIKQVVRAVRKVCAPR